MSERLDIEVFDDGSVVITEDAWPTPKPTLLFAVYKEDNGEVKANMIVENDNEWTAAEVLKAVGGLFGSLREQIQFGPGL